MKKKSLYIQIILGAVISLVGFNTKIIAQPKALIYNYKTGFSQPLPFDQPFMVELQGKPDSITNVKLVIKQTTLIHHGEEENSETNNKSNENDGFKNGIALEFTSNNLIQPAIIKKENGEILSYLLNPNQNYNCELSLTYKRKLSVDEKTTLIQILKEDEILWGRIYEKLIDKDVSMLNGNSFIKLVYERIREFNPNYIIDQNALPIDNIDVNNSVLSMNAALQTIGQDMKSISDAVDTIRGMNINSINDFKRLYIQIGDPDDNQYIANLNSSITNYLAEFNRLCSDFKVGVANSNNKVGLKRSLEDIVTKKSIEIQDQKLEYNSLITTINNLIIVSVSSTYIIESSASTFDSDEESTNRYGTSVVQNFGLGMDLKTKSTYLYVAYSVFFRPINNEVPLSNIPKKDRWKAMLGINMGFTLSDVTTNNYGEAQGIVSFLGNKGLLLGTCFRPFHIIKIDFNGMLYSLNDPNPLDNHRRLVCTPFLGISLNFNLIKMFSGKPNSFTTLVNELGKP